MKKIDTPTRVKRKRLPYILVVSILAVVLACAGAFAWAANYFETDYTWYTKNPNATEFKISTAGQLAALSSLVGGVAPEEVASSALSFEGKTISLTGDLTLFGASSDEGFLGNEFFPIGSADTPFQGTFNGCGHSLRYLRITDETANDWGYTHIGLFGYCGDKSTIKNLELDDTCSIKIECADTKTTLNYIGSLVGESAGKIENCISRAKVSVVWDDGNQGSSRDLANNVVASYIGGLAGTCDGGITDAQFSGSLTLKVKADAIYDKATKNTDAVITSYIGGVVGRVGIADDAGMGTSPAMTNCKNMGNVTVLTTGSGGEAAAGGYQDVKSGLVGGVAGYAAGNVYNCTNTADVLTTSYIPAATDAQTPDTVYGYDNMEECGYARAEGGGERVGGVVGGWRVNGETGHTASKYDPGFYGKQTTGTADEIVMSGCTNTGYISGLASVGGVCGVSGTYTTITRCINGDPLYVYRDDTYGRVRSTRWNKPCTGGIVARTYGDVSYCRNHGEVENTLTGYYNGGIAGYIGLYTDSSGNIAQETPEVWACYNTGQVHVSTHVSIKDPYRSGSIVGGNEGYVHDCLYLYGTLNASQKPLEAAFGEDYGTQARVQVAFASAEQVTQYGDSSSLVITASQASAALNASAAVEEWKSYWLVNASVNNGYPVLDGEAETDGIADLSLMQPSVELVEDARYSAAYNPIPTLSVSVVVNGEKRTLYENADYIVVPDEAALGQAPSSAGERPYKASIKGIGNYEGTIQDCADYGITKGLFSECSVVVASTTYREGIDQSSPEVSVIDAAGVAVPASSYTYVINNGDPCVNAGEYTVVVNAAEDSYYTGRIEGTYTIDYISLKNDCDVIGMAYQGRYWMYDDIAGKLYEVELEDGATELTRDDKTGKYNIKGFEFYKDDADAEDRTLSRATPKYTDENGLPIYGMAVDYTGETIRPDIIGVLYEGSVLPGGYDVPQDQRYYKAISGYTNGIYTGIGGGNIEASEPGQMLIGYESRKTRDYVIMLFDINPIKVSSSDISWTQSVRSLKYNGGQSYEKTSLGFVLYCNGKKVDEENYNVTPAYSVSSGGSGAKHSGSAMTYNVGDNLYYTVSFKEGGSISCADIEVGPWTVIDTQTNINEDFIKVEVDETGQSWTLNGPSPIKVRVIDTRTDTVLEEEKDYTVTDNRGLSTAWYEHKYPTVTNYYNERPWIQIWGKDAYTGVRAVITTMGSAIVKASDLEPNSPSYTGLARVMFLTQKDGEPTVYGNIPSLYKSAKGNTCLTYCEKGYDTAYLEENLGIGFRWSTETITQSGIGKRGGAQEENCFTVKSIVRKDTGEKVKKLKEIGVYSVTLVPRAGFIGGRLAFEDNFELTLDFEIKPCSLNSGDWTDPTTGEVASLTSGVKPLLLYLKGECSCQSEDQTYETRDYFTYDFTKYPYTGNPVTPTYVLLDQSPGTPDILRKTDVTATISYSKVSQYALDVELVPFVQGYGTVGPVEVGSGYQVISVSAPEDCTWLFGTTKFISNINYENNQFSIVAADISDSSEVEVKIADAVYDGTAQTPEVEFYVGGEKCNYVEGSDYKLEYLNNTEVGSAEDANGPQVKVTILNRDHLTAHAENGSRTDEVTFHFAITAAPTKLSDVKWNIGTTIALAESAQGEQGAAGEQGIAGTTGTTGSLSDVVLSGSYTTDAGTNLEVPVSAYTVETGVLTGETFTPKMSGWAAGDKVWLRVSAVEGNARFTGETILGPLSVSAVSKDNSFTYANEGDSLVATVDAGSVYTGAQITPQVSISAKGVSLTEGVDFKLTYGENTASGNGAGKVSVQGIGAYTGTCTLSFDIASAPLSSCEVKVNAQTYTGSRITPSATEVEVSLNGVVLPQSDWQILSWGEENTNAGEGTLTIGAASANLSGTRTASFTIAPRELTLSAYNVVVADQTYTGERIIPAEGDVIVTESATGKKLVRGQDYKVGVFNAVNAGTAQCLIQGMGNYTSSLEVDFTIKPLVLESSVAHIAFDGASDKGVLSLPYTGAAQTPSLKVLLADGSEVPSHTWAATYENNINAGTATAKVTGTGNYVGELSATFSIVPVELGNENASLEMAQTTYSYTSLAIEPAVTLRLAQQILPATDFDITYKNNTEVGTATLEVTGKGNVSGTLSLDFTIEQCDLKECTISEISLQPYAFGEAVCPEPIVTNPAGVVLEKGKDYTLTYSTNTEMGTATVSANAIEGGHYKGVKGTTFEIGRIPITTEDITFSPASFIYDGSKHVPEVSITVGGRTLKEGTDYRLNFLGDCTSAGTQAVEIITDGLATSVYEGGTVASYEIVKPFEPEVDKLSGESRYDTAAASALAAYSKSSTAVIATGANFPDALSASALAGLMECPILLTDPASLPDATKDAIKSLGVRHVVIVGGTSAVSEQVVSELKSLYVTVDKRLSGESRYETACAIYEYGKSINSGWSSTIIVASGRNFPDALSISPFAGSEHAPILLASEEGLGTSEQQIVSSGGFSRALVVGGTSAVPASAQNQLVSSLGRPNVTRLAGETRYDTSAEIAEWCVENAGFTLDGAGIATGANFPDALAAGPVLSRNKSVLLLAAEGEGNTTALDLLPESADGNPVSRIRIFGGNAAVPQSVRAYALNRLGWSVSLS